MADSYVLGVFGKGIGLLLTVYIAEQAGISSNPYPAVLSFRYGIGSFSSAEHLEAAAGHFAYTVSVRGNPDVAFTVRDNSVYLSILNFCLVTDMEFSLAVDHKTGFRTKPNISVLSLKNSSNRNAVQNCSCVNGNSFSVYNLYKA